MKLEIVGCSGSFSGPASAASCYLISAPDQAGRVWNLVVELGSGAFGALQRHVSPDDLDGIAITHLHADHCADLAGYNVYARYRPTGPVPPIPLWGPAHTHERIAADGDPSAPPSEVGARVLPWTDGSTVHLGPISITPHRVLHPVEAYGLRITAPREDGSGEAVLAFTGDSDLCDSLDAVAGGADLLLSEAAFQEGRDRVRGMHLTGKRAGQLAARNHVGQLVITHIPPWSDPERTRREVVSQWDGPLLLAAPGQVYTL